MFARFKILSLLLILVSLLLTTNYLLRTASADEIEDLQKQIDQLNQARELSVKATKPLEGQLESLQRQLAQIQANLNNLSASIRQKQKDLDIREDKLALQQALLEKRVRAYYIRSYLTDPLMVILSSIQSGDLFRELSYRQSVTREDRQIITSITGEVLDLLIQKDKLEKDQARLAILQADVDKNAQFLGGEVEKAKAYQADLSGKIAQLSAKQQEILAARSGQFTASIGDSELADDYNASIKGFRESAPGGSFAVFSFGAYTHRNGMSQYGALGRVKNNGSNYEQLLKYYYPGVQLTKADNKTITVYGPNSYGQSFNDENYQLEEYLKHIYEVPASWPKEVLKAQAVAARSYAYNKSRICSGQGCQEFKREENSDNWKNAVKETEGIIMTGGSGGYQYSSTTGGWINGIGWDTTDGGGGYNFMDKSYEKLAGSPWVYKAWYTQTYRNNSDKCGRSNPWLSGEELADIINATKFRDDRVTPVTTSCWGGNPYSHAELREKAGGPSNVTSVTVIQGNGSTNEVVFQTDKGEIRLNASEFKTAFNVRAPGRMSIPQSGFAFFNIEKK